MANDGTPQTYHCGWRPNCLNRIGDIPEDIMTQMKAHLPNCSECAAEVRAMYDRNRTTTDQRMLDQLTELVSVIP